MAEEYGLDPGTFEDILGREIKGMFVESNRVLGILERGKKQIVTVKDGFGEKKFLVKIYNPSQEKYKLNISPKEYIRYQFCNLKFWNEHGIPSPKVYKLYTQKDYETIIMEYIPTPSHDLDIIAIDTIIQKLEEIEQDPFYSKEIKSQIPKTIKSFNNLKNKIINSALCTIVKLSSLTNYIYSPEKDIDNEVAKRIFKPTLEFYSNKFNYYLETYLKWYFIKKDLDFNDKKIAEAKKKFKEAINFLIAPLLEKKYWDYVQGDEYLHHFKFWKKEGEKKEKSYIFDADRSMLGRIELSFAKLLLSYLLDLSYEEVHDKLKNAFEKYKREHKKDFDESYRTKCFDLVSLFELTTMLGKKANDELNNKIYYEAYTREIIKYRNPFINLCEICQPINITYEDYKTGTAIMKISRKLSEFLDKLLENKNPDYRFTNEELKSIDNLKKLCQEYKLTSLIVT